MEGGEQGTSEPSSDKTNGTTATVNAPQSDGANENSSAAPPGSTEPNPASAGVPLTIQKTGMFT